MSKHRNILILRTGDRYPVSDMTARYDVNAQPQLEVTVTSPSTDSLAAFLHRYGADLTRLFEITERDRLVARAEKYRDPKIGPLIREKFGFEMSIPQGYRVRLDTTDFLWISFELPLASVGFMIYTYPVADSTAAARNTSAGNIIAARNAAVMQVPGPSDGSYMSTSTAVMPDQKILTVHGRRWMQVRGFWDVTGDFMGAVHQLHDLRGGQRTHAGHRRLRLLTLAQQHGTHAGLRTTGRSHLHDGPNPEITRSLTDLYPFFGDGLELFLLTSFSSCYFGIICKLCFSNRRVLFSL